MCACLNRNFESRRIRATRALIVVAAALVPIGTCTAWSYSEIRDPFNDRPTQVVVMSRVNQFPLSAFRRSVGDDSVDLVIVLQDSKPLDPSKVILIRIDSNPTQELETYADGRLTLTHLFHKDRKSYYYDSLEFHGSNSEFSWRPNRIAIPVITDVDDRERIDTVPNHIGGGRLPFDLAKNPPNAPEGLFLRHLLKGNTLFLRYTALGGREVTESISLLGLSGPLERLLTKAANEKCSDAAMQAVIENGCYERAINAAQPLAPGMPFYEAPAFKRVFDVCFRDAKRTIPVCVR